MVVVLEAECRCEKDGVTTWYVYLAWGRSEKWKGEVRSGDSSSRGRAVGWFGVSAFERDGEELRWRWLTRYVPVFFVLCAAGCWKMVVTTQVSLFDAL